MVQGNNHTQRETERKREREGRGERDREEGRETETERKSNKLWGFQVKCTQEFFVLFLHFPL